MTFLGSQLCLSCVCVMLIRDAASAKKQKKFYLYFTLGGKYTLYFHHVHELNHLIVQAHYPCSDLTYQHRVVNHESVYRDLRRIIHPPKVCIAV